MKLVLLIFIVLVIWCSFFYAFERFMVWLSHRQKIERIKDTLYNYSDYFIMKSQSGKDYLIIGNKSFRI